MANQLVKMQFVAPTSSFGCGFNQLSTIVGLITNMFSLADPIPELTERMNCVECRVWSVEEESAGVRICGELFRHMAFNLAVTNAALCG